MTLARLRELANASVLSPEAASSSSVTVHNELTNCLTGGSSNQLPIIFWRCLPFSNKFITPCIQIVLFNKPSGWRVVYKMSDNSEKGGLWYTSSLLNCSASLHPGQNTGLKLFYKTSEGFFFFFLLFYPVHHPVTSQLSYSTFGSTSWEGTFRFINKSSDVWLIIWKLYLINSRTALLMMHQDQECSVKLKLTPLKYWFMIIFDKYFHFVTSFFNICDRYYHFNMTNVWCKWTLLHDNFHFHWKLYWNPDDV